MEDVRDGAASRVTVAIPYAAEFSVSVTLQLCMSSLLMMMIRTSEEATAISGHARHIGELVVAPAEASTRTLSPVAPRNILSASLRQEGEEEELKGNSDQHDQSMYDQAMIKVR